MRSGALARLAAPTSAGLAVRLTQLATLAALGLAAEEHATALVAVFGLASAFAVMSDAGAANYLLVRDPGSVTRADLRWCVGVQLAVGAAGSLAAVLMCLARFPELREAPTALTVVAVAVTPALDGASRVARALWLSRSDDRRFASFDFGLSGAKAAVLGLTVATADVTVLVLLPLVSIGVLYLGWRSTSRSLDGEAVRSVRLPDVLVYGANGAASALYSQSPLIIAGLTLPVGQVALLALCYRVTQSLELVPATLSQQAIPRFRDSTLPVVRATLAFTVVGAVLAAGVVAARPAIEFLFALEVDPFQVLVIVASAMPIKFASYALAGSLLAGGRVRAKLGVTLAVGGCAVIAATAVSRLDSVTGIALVTLVSEAGLLLGLLVVTLGSKPRTDRSPGTLKDEVVR